MLDAARGTVLATAGCSMAEHFARSGTHMLPILQALLNMPIEKASNQPRRIKASKQRRKMTKQSRKGNR